MTLKELREQKGLTRKEVAQKSGINFRTLQDYEQGHKNITSAKGETLYRLGLALGCSVDELLDIQVVQPVDEGQKAKETYKRLTRYYIEPPLTKNDIENQSIFSKEYKTYGRWRFSGDVCNLLFLYNGQIVQIPFKVKFTPKELPWLIEVALLEMETYIEFADFDRQFQWLGEGAGEEWQ